MSKSGPEGPAKAVMEGKMAEAKEGRDVSTCITEITDMFPYVPPMESHAVLLLRAIRTSQII